MFYKFKLNFRFRIEIAMSISAFLNISNVNSEELNKNVVAKVVNLKGDVFYTRLQKKIALNKEDSLIEGDLLETGNSGRLKLLLSDGGNELVLGSSTKLKLVKIGAATQNMTGTHLHLEEGMARSSVFKKYSGKGTDVFQVTTPNAVAGVRGTRFVVVFERSSFKSQILTETGAVSWKSTGGEQLIGAGMYSEVVNNKVLQPKKMKDQIIKLNELNEFESSKKNNSNDSENLNDLNSSNSGTTQEQFVDSSGNEILIVVENTPNNTSRSIASVPDSDTERTVIPVVSNPENSIKRVNVDTQIIESGGLASRSTVQNPPEFGQDLNPMLNRNEGQKLKELTQQKASQNLPTNVGVEIK